MIELKIGEQIYQMPENYDELKLKQYIEIVNLQSDDNIVGARKVIQLISILSGAPIDLLMKVKLSGLSQFDLEWLSKPIEKEIKTTIEIDEIKYGMIPDMKDLSLGEFADLDHYTKTINTNLHYVIAILMRPIIKENENLYIIEDYDTNTLELRANLFAEKMSVKQLINSSNFFLGSVNGYTKNMKDFLQKEMNQKIQMKQKKEKD